MHLYLQRECSLVQGVPAKQTYRELHAIRIFFFSFFRNPTKRAYSTVFKTWTIIMNKLFPLCITCFLNYMVILIYIRFVNYKMGTQWYKLYWYLNVNIHSTFLFYPTAFELSKLHVNCYFCNTLLNLKRVNWSTQILWRFINIIFIGVKDVQADHAASHLGRCYGMVSLLRAIPAQLSTGKVLIPHDLLAKVLHNVFTEVYIGTWIDLLLYTDFLMYRGTSALISKVKVIDLKVQV